MGALQEIQGEWDLEQLLGGGTIPELEVFWVSLESPRMLKLSWQESSTVFVQLGRLRSRVFSIILMQKKLYNLLEMAHLPFTDMLQLSKRLGSCLAGPCYLGGQPVCRLVGEEGCYPSCCNRASSFTSFKHLDAFDCKCIRGDY